MDAPHGLLPQRSESTTINKQSNRSSSTGSEVWQYSSTAASDLLPLQHHRHHHSHGCCDGDWRWSGRRDCDGEKRVVCCDGDESRSSSSSLSSLSSTARTDTQSSFSVRSDSVPPFSPIDDHRRNAASAPQKSAAPTHRLPTQIACYNCDDDGLGYGGGSSEFSQGTTTGYTSSPSVNQVINNEASPDFLYHRHVWNNQRDGDSDSESWVSASSRQLIDDNDVDGGPTKRSTVAAASVGCYGSGEAAELPRSTSTIVNSSIFDGYNNEPRTIKSCRVNANGGRASAKLGLTNSTLSQAAHLRREATALNKISIGEWPWRCPSAPALNTSSRFSTPVKDRFPSSCVQGYLRFAGDCDGPCYSFSAIAAASVSAVSEEVLFARAHRVDPEGDDYNWVYTFSSRRDNKKGYGSSRRGSWRKKTKSDASVSSSSDALGKMKVSRRSHCAIGHGGDDGATETEFVLYCEEETTVGYQKTELAAIILSTRSLVKDRVSQHEAAVANIGRVENGEATMPKSLAMKALLLRQDACIASRPLPVRKGLLLQEAGMATRALVKQGLIHEAAIATRPLLVRDLLLQAPAFAGGTVVKKGVVQQQAIIADRSRGQGAKNLLQDQGAAISDRIVAKKKDWLEAAVVNRSLVEKKDVTNRCVLNKGDLVLRLEQEEAMVERSLVKKEDLGLMQQQEAAGGVGWGAGFLKGSGGTGWGMRFLLDRTEPYLQEQEQQQRGKGRHLAAEVTVILPAGQHGHPSDSGSATKNAANVRGEDRRSGSTGSSTSNKNISCWGDGSHGPTPLMERWRLGGCHCGGWDLGCGLSVLTSNTLLIMAPQLPSNITLTRHDLLRSRWLSPRKPLTISTQGREPTALLVLDMVEPGLFSLRFQARFTPLQAFATAVAILHQQIA